MCFNIFQWLKAREIRTVRKKEIINHIITILYQGVHEKHHYRINNFINKVLSHTSFNEESSTTPDS